MINGNIALQVVQHLRSIYFSLQRKQPMQFFEKINEHNKFSLNKPANCDVVYYSELNEWFTTNAFRNFSLKYVLDQCIYYNVEGREHRVDAGNYLLGCKQNDVKAYFDNRQTVKSICIDICANTMAETFTVLTDKNENFDNYLAGYFKQPSFYETVNPVQSSSIANQLLPLAATVAIGLQPQINKEWFLSLSENIVRLEYRNYLFITQINAVRPSTKKELFRRLQLARDFMDQHFLEITEIKEIAEFCAMSEYHFFRRYKEVFEQTPYQYITEKKLQLAKDLLLQKKHSVTEVAMLCSYPDVFTFSKAFKKFYGVTPSSVA